MIEDNQVQGITVMALDEEESVFVNIIGSISPEELGKVMNNFDIDVDVDNDESDSDE